MANWFTRQLDRFTPFNMPGEVQRRKKKEEEQAQQRNNNAPRLSVGNATPQQRISVDGEEQSQPKPQQPINIFETLNKNLTFGQPNNIVSVFKTPDTRPVEQPKPGVVVRPTNQPQRISGVTTAPNQALRMNEKIFTRSPAAQVEQADPNIVAKNISLRNKLVATPALTGTRVGTGLIEGGGGLFDLLTPGKGQNRVTQKFTRQAEELDKRAKEIGVNKAYKTLNVPTEILTYFAGAPTKAGKVGKAPAVIQRMIKAIGGGSRGRRIATQAAEELVDPRNIAQEARLTGRYTGQDSARGKDIDARYIAENAAMSLGGAFAPAVLRNLRRVPGADVRRGVDEAGSGISAVTQIDDLLSDADIQDILTTRIPVRQNIPVDNGVSIGQPVNVRNLTEPKPVIREFPGDATSATSNSLIQRFADDVKEQSTREVAFDQAKNARPDYRVDGSKPGVPEKSFALNSEAVATGQNKLIDEYADFLKQVGEGNGVVITPDGRRVSNNVRPKDFGSKKATKAMWREEAERQLRAGEADPSIQKVFDESADPEVQALLSKGERPDAPVGRPITVKQIKGLPGRPIPVRDETVVPTGLPETPGTVRATTQTSPMAAKTEAVANAPVVASPAQLPAETQAILDNPRQFSKRQVAAARNQRKLARQMAKTTEQTAEAMERINTASPATVSGEGFVPTGEFGKSVNGGPIQRASRAVEMAQAVEETSQMSPSDVLQTARRNQAETGGFNRRDIRNIAAMFETKRLPRGSAEWNEARQILKEDGTIWGQTGALRNYTMRRTATADELINRYESKIYRLADDPTKIDSRWFDEVEAAETAYTDARDQALRAYNAFTENPTSANAKAYHAAQDAAEKADKAAKMTEYKVAEKALKGNKDVKQMRELEKMANEADLYQMDAVDASMLSGTGTFVRNIVNAAVGGIEETLFGKAGAKLASLTKRSRVNDVTLGGGVGRGTLSGFGEGVSNVVDASKARAGNAGKNPLSHIKNWATTGNQLGDTIIDSQTKHNVLDHYTQLLKKQGYKGRELTDRASVMARQDPDDLGRIYASAARTAAGLGGGITRGNKIETFFKNGISDIISGGKPNQFTEGAAKLVTRMTIGFPTAIGRSTIEGVKRFSLGAPTFIKALRTTDPVQRAVLVKEGIKQAGSGGLVIPPLFYAMGASDMITGAYPIDDKEERARWEREGITENSVKIGDEYYQLPAYLGSWAVPALFYASLGRNDGDFATAATDTAKIVPDILPADQASKVFDVVYGRKEIGEYLSETGASAVRATTPAGALLNQISKSIDPTKNDTSAGTNWENFINRVVSGVPGVNEGLVDVPTKEDDAGNPIVNPGAVPLLFGAASTSQNKGIERSSQIQANINSDVQKMSELGVLGDPNLEAVLDDKERLIYEKLKAGKKLGDGDLKKLQDAFIKGVSSTGDDTAYLEREQYDSNLAALKMKKQLMEADKTVKPSDLKKMDIAIKRGEIYKDNEIPYDLISEYQSVGVEEWRKMGIGPDDEDYDADAYDPDMYEKLWQIDQKLTKAGVSYKKGALDKQKYFVKDAGKGKGKGKRTKQLDTSFGTLKSGSFAPRVQEYASIDAKSGSIPIIRTVRPNIVHKISSG